MTYCSRNGESSTEAFMIAVGSVGAVVPSDMMMTQNEPIIHHKDHLPGSVLLSFPLSTIMY